MTKIFLLFVVVVLTISCIAGGHSVGGHSGIKEDIVREIKRSPIREAWEKHKNCQSKRSCLGPIYYLGNTNYCKINKIGNVDTLPVIKNNCNSKIVCKLCAFEPGRTEEKCEFAFVSPMKSMGGWITDLVWCDVTSVRVDDCFPSYNCFKNNEGGS